MKISWLNPKDYRRSKVPGSRLRREVEKLDVTSFQSSAPAACFLHPRLLETLQIQIRSLHWHCTVHTRDRISGGMTV